jgi:hypothetical protein
MELKLMDRKSNRPSQSKEWTQNLDVTINLTENDEIYQYRTDEHGNVRTNKRAWSGLNTTVILGDFNRTEIGIFIPKGIRVWSCLISTSGRVSSIGLPDTEVTLIIHK